MRDDARLWSATEIVDHVSSAWEAGQSDEVIVDQLSELGLCEEHAAEAIDMVRSAYGRAALLNGLGINESQFDSNFEDDPIFQAALTKARAELGVGPTQEKRRSLSQLESDLKDTNPETRRKAAYELGQSKDQSATPLLLGVLHDPDVEVRIYAIQSLRDLRSKDAVPALAAILKSEKDDTILSNVFHALAAIGDPTAAPALIETTRHPDPAVRSLAAWALGELGDQQSIPALEALLNDTTQPPDNMFRVCEQAETALQKLRRGSRWVSKVRNFIVACVLGALVGSLSWGAMFAIFGVIAWLFTGDAGIIFPLAVFGAVAGILFGIGGVIVAVAKGTTRFGKREPQAAERANHSGSGECAESGLLLLDQAEAFVLDLWNKQGSLVRQAVFWDARGSMSMVGFTSAVSRDALLPELRNAAKDKTPMRVFFFYESSAFAPDGRESDVIVLEVGDAQLGFYGQRIYSAQKQPKRLAEETALLGESPFAGLLGTQ